MQQTFMSTKLLMTCLLFAVLAVSTACDREDDLSLTGTSWKLYGYVDTSDNTVKIPSVPPDDEPRQLAIRFSVEGKVMGYAISNELLGDYRVLGDSIRIFPLARTKVGIPSGYEKVEEYFITSLVGHFKYEIRNGQLRLYKNKGNEYMLFNKWGGSVTRYNPE